MDISGSTESLEATFTSSCDVCRIPHGAVV